MTDNSKPANQPEPGIKPMTKDEILKRNEWLPDAGWTKENILSAMDEYATHLKEENQRLREALELITKVEEKPGELYPNIIGRMQRIASHALSTKQKGE